MDTHILVVNDDPLHGRLLTFLLADAGFATSTLADPRPLDAVLRARAIDLILLAVKLPLYIGEDPMWGERLEGPGGSDHVL
jgi:DNA-binding response OmpR family regulator